MRRLVLALLVGLPAPVHADPARAFCELTPCVPGPVTRRMLKKDEQVGQVTCKRGHELGVDARQRIVFCTTAKPVDVDGLAIATSAYTLFHPNGRIYQTHVRKPFERTLADRTRVKCGAELVALFEDGGLQYCTLAAKRAGTPRARVGEGIAFHPDGRVASLTLDEPYAAAGLALPAGTSVAWDARGRLSGGHASTPIAAGGLSIRGDFELHGSGKLRIAQLAAPARLTGHELPDGARLQFRADGTLERAVYVENRGFLPHGEQWTDTRHLAFDARGKITSSTVDRWQEPYGEDRRSRP